MKIFLEIIAFLTFLLYKEERDQYNYDIGCGEKPIR